MEIKKKLEASLKEAMRAGDETRKRTIRLALSSIKLAEIDQGNELDDARILSILQKEIKSREESIDAAKSGGRPDLVDSANAEIAVLKDFLPEQMGEEEIIRLAHEAISEAGASSPADMGKVMKMLLPKIQGRAASSQVSQIVKKLLNE